MSVAMMFKYSFNEVKAGPNNREFNNPEDRERILY